MYPANIARNGTAEQKNAEVSHAKHENPHECAVELARRAAAAAHGIVCGQCTFGREGTRQLADVLMDLTRGRGRPGDLELLRNIGEGMKDGSACANGRNAGRALVAALEQFRAEFEAHVQAKKCPANVCAIGDHR